MYYADPDEFLRKENIYSADPKESEPAADDSNQMEDHPEDHIPTYADPRTIEREAAPETGDVYTLVDMSKKQVTVVMEENPYEPVEIEKTDVRSWTIGGWTLTIGFSELSYMLTSLFLSSTNSNLQSCTMLYWICSRMKRNPRMYLHLRNQ